MDDKFFDSAKDRFDYHASRITNDVRYLEYFVSDFYKNISPEFIRELDSIKSSLNKMKDMVDRIE